MRELAEGRVLLTSRALDAGWPKRSLARALRADGWTLLRNGAWAEPGRKPDLVTRLRAEQLLNPRLVVSHRSAAPLWRIETLTRASRTPLEFTDPELSHRPEGRDVRVYRTRLEPADVFERRGLRVTGPVRTLTDLLLTGPRDDALVAVESGLARRTVDGVRRAPLTDLDTISSALGARVQARARGAARACTWLRLCDPLAGSPAETIARLRMYGAGLRPESQVALRAPDGRRTVLDFFFRAEGLAVEIEGYAYHGARDAHRRDVIRFNSLQQCPEVRRVLRFTAEDVFHHPGRMIQEIRALLAAETGRGVV
ncbi:hypothetical protein SAURM35S_09668 [Streptomyces aurantiogriseus]|uniref:DUF559 domain-containing protein n=1 Tax=Streptomyces aurantiogriseus TaxID=66870 RepID=A0A918F710_9ACTN|nr:hypothetical protein GCM10010251_24040 [Streptomyces aurantiogriseus]